MQDTLAWIRNLAVGDELYEKYSVRPDIRLDCERAVHCCLRSSPLDWKLGTCDKQYHCSPVA